MEKAEFLLARVAEDEAEIALGFEFATLNTSGWMGHAASWDRKRALAECEAKRRIVEAYVSAVRVYALHDSRRFPDGSPTSRLQVAAEEMNVLLPTLAYLAVPYAEHPDYDAAWRPAEALRV